MNRKNKTMDHANDIRWRGLLGNISIGLVYVEDNHITLNQAAEKITGYNRNELTTLDEFSDLFQGEHVGTIRQLFDRDQQDDCASQTFPFTLIRKNGEVRHVEFSTCQFEDKEIWLLFDITDLIHSEEEVHLRDQAIQATSTGVVIVDACLDDNPAVFVNKAFETISGYSAEEVMGRNLRFLHKSDDDQPGVQEISKALQSGREATAVLRNYRKDGTPYWNELTISPVHNRQGRLTHFVGIQNDITQHKLDEEALKKSEHRMRAILDTASDAIISINHNGTITDINPATEKMFGYTQQELLYQQINILMPAPWSYEHGKYIKRYLKTGKSRVIGAGRELLGKRKDGSTFPIYLTVSRVAQINIFTGIIRDMSEQKELQKQVLEIAAQEDRRIGLELHDDIQQQLTGLGMMAKSVLNQIEEITSQSQDPQLDKIVVLVKEMSQGLNKSVSHVNLLARGLVPVEVDAEGLRASLSELCSRINKQYDIECHFSSQGNVKVNDNFVATHLYRIAQEALNNAIKHSQSQYIGIALMGDDEKISLSVLDKGVGFIEKGVSETGLGHRIMGYRANLIGARVSIDHIEEAGIQVSCVLPR